MELVKFKLDDLKLIFDELVSPSFENQEQQDRYAFRDTRGDGIKLHFYVLSTENTVAIEVYCAAEVCAASVSISTCREIQVANFAIGHRVIEVLWGDDESELRKFVLDLDGTKILGLDIGGCSW